jgi:hypothetical protein
MGVGTLRGRFLALYKIFEIVSNYHFKKNIKPAFKESKDKDKEINNIVTKAINELETSRRKIKVRLNHYKVVDFNEQVGQIVRLRNSIAAHGSQSDFDWKSELTLISYAEKLSKELISKIVLDTNYKTAYLDWDYSQWTKKWLNID